MSPQAIRLGVLMDYAISATQSRKDIVDSLELVFNDAVAEHVISICGSDDWLGAGYLVARTLDPEGQRNGTPWKTHLVGRYGSE